MEGGEKGSGREGKLEERKLMRRNTVRGKRGRILREVLEGRKGGKERKGEVESEGRQDEKVRGENCERRLRRRKREGKGCEGRE